MHIILGIMGGMIIFHWIRSNAEASKKMTVQHAEIEILKELAILREERNKSQS